VKTVRIFSWSLVVLIVALPGCGSSGAQGNNLAGGDGEKGKLAIRAYGCGACHTIPGVRGANSVVGPNLSGIAERSYIAGVLTNSPDNLIRWIENPQAVDEKTLMPNMNVSARDARNIAAYLYTLH
jgi:cytochrome c